VGGQVFGFEHGGSRRYAELVNRLFQMEAGDAPLPPGFILELDRPEWSFLKRELWWTTGPQFIAAAVGNFSRLQIKNPTKDAIVVITNVVAIQQAAVANIDVSYDAAVIGAGVTANLALDTRVPLNSALTTRPVRSQNAIDNSLPATSGSIVDRFIVNLNTATRWNLPFLIIAPGGRVDVTQRLANTTAQLEAVGYERPATPDELAL